jgi:hypothetical protein
MTFVLRLLFEFAAEITVPSASETIGSIIVIIFKNEKYNFKENQDFGYKIPCFARKNNLATFQI